MTVFCFVFVLFCYHRLCLLCFSGKRFLLLKKFQVSGELFLKNWRRKSDLRWRKGNSLSNEPSISDNPGNEFLRHLEWRIFASEQVTFICTLLLLILASTRFPSYPSEIRGMWRGERAFLRRLSLRRLRKNAVIFDFPSLYVILRFQTH